jgi:hypothetical protein
MQVVTNAMNATDRELQTIHRAGGGLEMAKPTIRALAQALTAPTSEVERSCGCIRTNSQLSIVQLSP